MLTEEYSIFLDRSDTDFLDDEITVLSRTSAAMSALFAVLCAAMRSRVSVFRLCFSCGKESIMENMNAMPMITAKTTLGELLKMLDLTPGQRKKGKTPTRVNLIATGGEPIAERSGCKVFSNGYALYDNGLGRHTVLWLPYCTAFTYYFNKLRDSEKSYLNEYKDLPDGFLENTKWTAAVALFGEERITQNMLKGFGNADPVEDFTGMEDSEEPTIEDYPNPRTDVRDFTWDEAIGADPFDILRRKENRRELLRRMSLKQREAFILSHRYGYTQREIGRILKINHRAVGFRLEKANQIAREYFS